MRARELRDVIEVLIIPSLERALNELNKPRGNRRRARLLVQQSVDQLFGMMVVHKKPETVEERCGAAAAGAKESGLANRLDFGRLQGSNNREVWTTVDEVTDELKYYRRAGDPDHVVLRGDPASQLTSARETPPTSEVSPNAEVEHEFKSGMCRCGVIEGSEASVLSCPGEDASKQADATENPAWQGTRSGS